MQLYADGHYQEAREILQKRASRNDPIANYFLAQMYERGDGVTADLNHALNLYMLSASRGLPQGQAALAALQATAAEGDALANLLQTLQDLADQQPEAGLPRHCEALLYLAIKDTETDYGSGFLSCADKLSAYDAVLANRLRASAEFAGVLGKKDNAKGVSYATQAADEGDPGAHAILAAAYAEGLGKAQDFRRAYAHAATAIALGDKLLSDKRRKEMERLQKRAFRNLSQSAQREAEKLAGSFKASGEEKLRDRERTHRFGWAMQTATPEPAGSP